jgi:arginase
MPLAIATGRCWQNLARTIPGFAPIDPRRVIHAGSRDYSPGEREALVADGVRMEPRFDGIDAKRILIHVDLDVIDARYGRANHYACAGGLSPDEVLQIIEDARQHFTIAGLVLASYDPSCDTNGTIADAAARIVRSVVAD